ncbi:MAG: PHP domain-containing protein [Ignavibacteriales bacterium]|nr:PHP domain-containing protein [Ignavibacteriales bacterium]
MKTAVHSFVLTFIFSLFLFSHDHDHGGRTIDFPNIPGYLTFKCDFHQHTVFSDGDVWPTIRVQEAIKDGLDAISLTEHLEYQPHKNDIPHPDRNRAYTLALNEAKNSNLIVVNGSEITRRMPPGHSNAIFISDANKLLVADSVEVFREAKKQGAFTFWNHPNWIGQSTTGIATLTDVHKFLLKEKLLDGIEVVNDVTYSDEALQIALDHDLTIMGTSDIHGLIDWQYNVPDGGHRPITLVFAKERSAESIKEALFARRTAVWFNNTLIGREEFLLPLIKQSLKIRSAVYQNKKSVLNVTIENSSDAEYILQNNSDYTFHAHANVVTLKPHEATTLEVKTVEPLKNIQLKFSVLNAVVAPKKHPEIIFDVVIQ